MYKWCLCSSALPVSHLPRASKRKETNLRAWRERACKVLSRKESWRRRKWPTWQRLSSPQLPLPQTLNSFLVMKLLKINLWNRKLKCKCCSSSGCQYRWSGSNHPFLLMPFLHKIPGEINWESLDHYLEARTRKYLQILCLFRISFIHSVTALSFLLQNSCCLC